MFQRRRRCNVHQLSASIDSRQFYIFLHIKWSNNDCTVAAADGQRPLIMQFQNYRSSPPSPTARITIVISNQKQRIQIKHTEIIIIILHTTIFSIIDRIDNIIARRYTVSSTTETFINLFTLNASDRGSHAQYTLYIVIPTYSCIRRGRV